MIRGAVAAEISVAEVIAENDNDVGLRWPLREKGSTGRSWEIRKSGETSIKWCGNRSRSCVVGRDALVPWASIQGKDTGTGTVAVPARIKIFDDTGILTRDVVCLPTILIKVIELPRLAVFRNEFPVTLAHCLVTFVFSE
jgi:hypothetical protein